MFHVAVLEIRSRAIFISRIPTGDERGGGVHRVQIFTLTLWQITVFVIDLLHWIN